MLLLEMQQLLHDVYDAPTDYNIYDFLITDRHTATELNHGHALSTADEHILLEDNAATPSLSVYIDASVLERLASNNPLHNLNQENLTDYCTALEGVSHFNYLAWSIHLNHNVSLLELEFQAEVDKYVAAVILTMMQNAGVFPTSLHSRLFSQVTFLPDLDAASLQRYKEVNRYAAYYCRSLDERFLRRRRQQTTAWFAALRQLYRYGHHTKMRHALR